MRADSLKRTLWIALSATILATSGQAYQRADMPEQRRASPYSDTSPYSDIGTFGYLSRELPETYGTRVAQEGGDVERSLRPRARPSGLAVSGLVGENSALGEPVAVDQTGTIVRPRPRADTATDITDRAIVEQLPDNQDTVELTAEPADDILRPLARPQGFGQEVRSASSAQQIRRVQQENESTPSTPTVRRAANAEHQIPLDQMTLIGIFGTDETRRALLRLPNGDFQPIARGTVVDGWRVLTIDRAAVRISRNSEVLVLEMP